MIFPSKAIPFIAATAKVSTLVVGSTLTASPAQAATKCSRFIFTETWAGAECQGAGQMRFKLTCNSLWPFSPWTKYSGWISIGAAKKSVTARFPDCGWTSTLTGQYR